MEKFKVVKSISVKPATEFVLVKVDQEHAEKTAGGIIIPNGALQNKKTQTGVVVEAGPGRFDATSGKAVPAVEVQPGQRIIFACYIGYPVVLGDRGEHVIIKHNDIMGFVEEDAEYLDEDSVPSNIIRDSSRAVA